MTFAELRQEVKDSGLDHLSDSRVNRLVNLAYKRTFNRELWPWRLSSTSGAVPLALSGVVEQVTTADGYSLSPITQAQLENSGYDLTSTGTAEYWYLDNNRDVATYPVDSGGVIVRYFAKATDLSADSDVPDFPADYHYLIVLDAVRRGKLENGEGDVAQQYAFDYNELLADCKRDSFNEQVAGGYQLNDLSEGV